MKMAGYIVAHGQRGHRADTPGGGGFLFGGIPLLNPANTIFHTQAIF